jgi:hypothetical protein
MWGGDSCPPLLTFLNSATQYQKIPPKQSLKSGLQARPPHTSKPKQVLLKLNDNVPFRTF